MQPKNPLDETDTQERERAKKLSQLYPQPDEYSRSFTYTPNVTSASESIEGDSNHPTRLPLIGAMTSLPLIAFEVGRSTLTKTTTLTEASQLGMLSLLYLVFVAGLILLTYKLFIKQSQVTAISPRFAYWAVLLFSIPTVLLFKDFLLGESSTALATAIYYVAIIFTFAVAAVLFARLKQRAIIILLMAPYILGAVRAIF